MESYYNYDNSNSDSYSSSYSTHAPHQYQHLNPQQAYTSSLHSTRKAPGKRVITKKPIAPMPPTPPKVYKVEAGEFKDVVQRLTGPTTRLQEVAPPPLSLSTPPRPLLPSDGGLQEDRFQKSFESVFGGLSPLGFSLSPASVAWCASMLLSPLSSPVL